ncbi:porin [Vibrio sp. dsl-7]|uniref:Porin n=1 Tax=Vibrio chanodichtyis TaxID=3027932 RepID=A0ABT5UWR2_9VIBR|nr:porin [Vibrio chanodichtyis]MDE1513877.1 porin [Vibrio chanodichtyis]
MKKTAIAVAILSAVVSGSSLAATVYSKDGTELKVGGRVEFRGDFIGDEKGKEIDGTMADKTRARLNLAGTTDIGENLQAFAFYEAEQSTGASTFTNRYMYGGVKSNFGAFSVGKQNSAAVVISDFTDITNFSGVQQVIDAAKDKRDSTFAYRGDFDALKLQATYTASSDESKDLMGISAVYALPMGLNLGVAYSTGENGKDEGDQSQILAGLGYKADNLYLAATYSTGDYDDKAKKEFTAYELVAQYNITKPLSLAVLYTFKENDTNGATTDVTDGIELMANYRFNSNFRTYVSYYLNQLDEVKTDGKTTAGEDTLRLGLRYDF